MQIPVFEPDEIWKPRTPEFNIEPAILTARENLNRKDPAELISKLRDEVQRSPNGIVYAVLKGESPAEYSDTDAIVMFNPFANTATANMLVRAEFIREVAKEANLRDQDGKLKPVIVLSSPGLHGSKLHLSPEEKQEVRSGNLGPAAREYLQAVSELSYGHVALLGYSQGAGLAVAGAKNSSSANLDKTSLGLGEPAGIVDRTLPTLANDFFHSGPDVEERSRDSGLKPLDIARPKMWADYNFLASSLSRSNLNLLGRAMAADSFQATLQQVLDEGQVDKIVVAYGELSTISQAEKIEPQLAALRSQVKHDQLFTIKVKGGTHAWGEDLTVLAKLYLKALA